MTLSPSAKISSRAAILVPLFLCCAACSSLNRRDTPPVATPPVQGEAPSSGSARAASGAGGAAEPGTPLPITPGPSPESSAVMGVDPRQTQENPAQAVTPDGGASQKKDEDKGFGTALWESLVRKNVVLLSPGAFEIEPSLTYVPTSSDFVNIDGFSIFPVLIVGSVTSETVRKDNFIAAVTARAGLPWGMQADVKVPFQYDVEERTRADGRFSHKEEHGLGDASVGLSKELVVGKEHWPNLIGRVQYKSTTGKSIYDGGRIGIGSGFHALRGEMIVLESTDPAAIYASVGYTANLAATKNGSKINPGDTVDASIGTTIALNSDLAVSLGVEGSWTANSSLNGNTVNGSSFNVANMDFGLSYKLFRTRRLDMNFSAGLTRDAPDYSVTFSMPFRF